jgi:hypothetical protein
VIPISVPLAASSYKSNQKSFTRRILFFSSLCV